MNVSSYSGMMINVTRKTFPPPLLPFNPTAESNFVTLILKLLMTLLWTVNIPHDKIDEHRPTRKPEKWLSPFLPFNREFLDCYLYPKPQESGNPHKKHLFELKFSMPPNLILSFVKTRITVAAALRVGEQAINFYLCPFVRRRKICVINNYLTFSYHHQQGKGKKKSVLKVKWVALFVI